MTKLIDKGEKLYEISRRKNHNPGYREIVESLKVGDSAVFKGLTSSGVCSRLYRHARRVKAVLATRTLYDDAGEPYAVRVRRVS